MLKNRVRRGLTALLGVVVVAGLSLPAVVSAGTTPTGPPIPGGVNGPDGAAFRSPPASAETPAKRGPKTQSPYAPQNWAGIKPLHPASPIKTSALTHLETPVMSLLTAVVPTVTTFTPTNGATGVPITAVPSAAWNEPINKGLVNWTFQDSSGVTVPVNEVYNAAAMSVVLAPKSKLVNGVTYNLVVWATDLNGVKSAKFFWSFTTVPIPVDNPPVALLTATPSSGSLAVGFDASASTDTDATPISTYAFDFGDGTTAPTQASPKVSHTYANAGTYLTTVTVTDTAKQASQATASVTVSTVRPLLNTVCTGGYANFTFDDGPDVTTTQPLLDAMKALNMTGIFFVIGQNVQGTAGTQLVKNEVANGNLVENHTWDHQSFTGASTGTAHLTNAQILSEIGQTQNVITAAGLPAPTMYRPPYGDIDNSTDTLIRNNYGLQVVDPFANVGNTDGIIADSRDWEGVSVAQIVQNITIGYTSTSGRFYPGMSQSVPTTGQPVVLAFHDTIANDLPALQPIVDWMNTNLFCSATNVRANATGGLVLPPPPGEPTTGNIVVNPSQENMWAAGNAGSFPTTWPAGWMTAGWGTHTTVYGTTTDSHTGAVATTLTVSNWVSGDSKWLIVQRGQGTDSSNSYTPAAQPGHTYNMWVYYKGVWSGSSAGITAYYRDANNVWQYWTSGFLASPSDSWNLSNFTTPPLPAGATAVSFGMSLTGNGTLTTDDYAMTVNP